MPPTALLRLGADRGGLKLKPILSDSTISCGVDFAETGYLYQSTE